MFTLIIKGKDNTLRANDIYPISVGTKMIDSMGELTYAH